MSVGPTIVDSLFSHISQISLALYLWVSRLAALQVEASALLLHLGLPFPLERIVTLTARSADALVYSPEFESHP